MKNTINKKVVNTFTKTNQTTFNTLDKSKQITQAMSNKTFRDYAKVNILPSTHYKSFASFNADFKNKLRVFNFVSGDNLTTAHAKSIIARQIRESGSSELLDKVNKMSGYSGNAFKRFRGRMEMLGNVKAIDKLTKRQQELLKLGQQDFLDRYEGLINKTNQGQFKQLYDLYVDRFGYFKALEMLKRAIQNARGKGGLMNSDEIAVEFEYLTRDELNDSQLNP